MRFITKILSAVATTAATTATGLCVRKYMKEKEEDKWTKEQLAEAERLALPNLAKQLSTKHSVCLKIKNKTDVTLHNPQVYSAFGEIKRSVPQTIKPGKYECMAVEKSNSYYVKGISGVLTYDVGDTNNRLCIYYYDPYIGFNAFGLHWDSVKRSVNEGLLKQITSGNEIWSTKGTIAWHSKSANDYELFGFISQGDPANLHIVLTNKS